VLVDWRPMTGAMLLSANCAGLIGAQFLRKRLTTAGTDKRIPAFSAPPPATARPCG
jgi:hypothetical protein